MNRIYGFLLAIFICIVTPINACASQLWTGNATPTPTSKSAVEVKSKDELIQAIKDKAVGFETDMIFTINNYKEADYKINPLEIIAINSYHLTISTIGTKATLTYTFDYFMADKIIYAFKKNSTDILDQKSLEVYNVTKKIIQDSITGTMSDYDKEKTIHDYLILNAKYDEANANAKTMNDSATPYGLLIKKTGVCQAYAESMRMFMTVLGIECETVSSTSDTFNHAWNVIKLEDKYYMLDVTWDDPLPDRPGQVDYTYFNITTEKLVKDHQWSPSPQYVCDSLKFNYYYYNNLIVKNQTDFEGLVKSGADKKQSVIEFICEGIKPQSLNLEYVFNYAAKFSYTINENYSIVRIILSK